jgi:hypothetical protein
VCVSHIRVFHTYCTITCKVDSCSSNWAFTRRVTSATKLGGVWDRARGRVKTLCAKGGGGEVG